jgi:prolyl 4-hydroxylase
MQAPDPMLLHAFSLMNAQREQEALVIFGELADRNDPGALATLAQLNWTGTLVPRNYAKGRDYYYRAGEAGHAACALYATNLIGNGYAGKRDWPLALQRLRREAESDPKRAEIWNALAGMDLTDQGDPRTLPAGELLSDSLDVQIFRGAFSHAECDYLFRLEKTDYARATVVDEATGVSRIDPVRTADETHVHWEIENPLVHAFTRRIAALSGTQVDWGEPLQMLRYRPGQQYLNHFDYIPGAGNQRIKTAILYLNEDYSGGETGFPKIGLKVRGRTGDVLLFRNSQEGGRRIENSEHAGMPVLAGVKHIATRWIRTTTYTARSLSGD